MVHKFSGIVKRQLDYWRYQVANFGPDHPRYRPTKMAKYQHLIREFGELAEYLDGLAEQEDVDDPAAPEPPPHFFVAPKRRVSAEHIKPVLEQTDYEVPDNLADLPRELLNELSESIKGETDPLINIINGRGGTATLDEILIDLYRKYKEIGKRPIISNKLYRLSRRGLCWPLPGKKGVYSTTKPSESDSENDDGSDAPGSEPSSDKSKAAASSSPSVASSKIRRDLLTSTAIPAVPHIARR